MHAYRDQYASLFHGGRDIVLIGISTDSPEALQSWAQDPQAYVELGEALDQIAPLTEADAGN